MKHPTVAVPAVPAVLAALVLGAGACAPPAQPSLVAHSTTRPVSGPCTADDSSADDFADEVATIRATVTGADLGRFPIVAEAPLAAGAITLDAIPAGFDRAVGVFGIAGGAAPVWRGVAANVDVKAPSTSIDVLMARIGDFTCARGADVDRRAFHTATVLDDGKILLAGGAAEGSDASATCGAGCHRLTATSGAALYDPRTGVIVAASEMAQARLFHVAAKLGDGRVVVAGGAAGALVHPVDDAFPFPVAPVDVVDAVELFDPATLTFTSIGVDPNGPRVFAAASTDDNGNVVITGGVPGAADAGDPNDLGNALASTTLCTPAPGCGPGPAMASRRAGHAAFLIPGDGVFIWGGSIDVDVDGERGFDLERIDGVVSTPVQVAAMNARRNLFFAAYAQYLPFRIAAAGGLERAADGTFTLALADDEAAAAAGGGAFYVYSETDGGQNGGIQNGKPPSDVAAHLVAPSFFASAAPLPGGSRVVVAGGFADLAFTPSADVHLFDEASLTVSPITVGGAPRTLRQARGGLVAAANGDGTVIFSGGEALEASGVRRAPIDTVEIFADVLTPKGIAE